MPTDQDSFKVYIPKPEAARVRELADQDGRTVTGLVRMLLRRYIAEQENTANSGQPGGTPLATTGTDG